MSFNIKMFVIGMTSGIITAIFISNFVFIHYYKQLYRMQQLNTPEKLWGLAYNLTENHENAQLISPVSELHLDEDQHMHHDDDSVARKLYNHVRVLVFVMTSPKNIGKKTNIVKDTWGKHCNKLIFFSLEDNATRLDVSEDKDHLTKKTIQGLQYVYTHFFNKADWFMKADDDTYVIVENLRYFLSDQNTSDPIVFGHHFQQSYYRGGGGYVFSKEALRRLAERGDNSKICRQLGGTENAELELCMQKLGVKIGDSTDALGRSRFHFLETEDHVLKTFPQLFYLYDANGTKKEPESISDYAISFQYASPEQMLLLEYFIYHLRPYGINTRHQSLNNRIDKI